MSDLASRISALSPAQRAVFEARLRERGIDMRETAPLLAAANGARFLSFAQERIWLHEQLAPAEVLYVESQAISLRGPLVVDALTRSLAAVVSRHELLRAELTAQNGEPSVRVVSEVPVDLEYEDLRSLDDADRSARLEHLVTHPSAFPSLRPPLFRARLLRMADDEHRLLMTMHHLVCDGWSIGVLIRELAANYPAFLRGEPSPLPPLAAQYFDFSAWQREQLKGERLACLVEFWRKALDGADLMLELPTDEPRRASPSSRGARPRFSLSRETSSRVASLARRENATTFMILLAAFTAVLSTATGETEIVVGTACAGRPRAWVEPLIGFFVNTLPVRVSHRGEPTFRELVSRTRRAALDAFAHQDMPYELLRRAVAPRSAPRPPPVMFAFQNPPIHSLRAGDIELSLSLVEADKGTAMFELLLTMIEHDGVLQGSIEYATDLFHPSTIARLIAHLQAVITLAVENPERPMRDILAEAMPHDVDPSPNEAAQLLMQDFTFDDGGDA